MECNGVKDIFAGQGSNWQATLSDAAQAPATAQNLREVLAEDFVRHWEDRRENMREFIGAPGKAMIVTATRSIAARLYSKIVALRPEWHSDADDKGKIKVIYSAAPSECHSGRSATILE